MVNVTVKSKQNHNVKKGVSDGSIYGLREITQAIQSQAKVLATGKNSLGFLRASIKNRIRKFKGYVFTGLVYSKIQEFGGVIRPINGKYLTFKGSSGNWVSVKKVTIPGLNGGKGYLRPAVDIIRRKIPSTMGKNIRSGIRRN